MGHLFEEGFHFLTHFEGTFFTTLKALFRHPGRLAADYAADRRKPYFKPVSFYLLVVVVYLIFPLARGLNMEMRNYRGLSGSGPLIARQIEGRMQREGVPEAVLAERFAKKSSTVSKALLFLLIPLSAVVFFALYPGRKRYWFDNLILATEVNSVYVVAFYLLLPLLILAVLYAAGGGEVVDAWVGMGVMLVFGCYAGVVFRRTFGSRWRVAMCKGLLFSVVHSFMVMPVYKTVVFAVTWLWV